MQLTKYEQETIINFNEDESTAELYTCSSVMMRKLDKLVEVNPEAYQVKSEDFSYGKLVSKTYIFPKGLITLRKPTVLSEDKKQAKIKNLSKRNA